jgi:hypothetical protein
MAQSMMPFVQKKRKEKKRTPDPHDIISGDKSLEQEGCLTAGT